MNKNLFDRFMAGKVAVHVSTQEQCSEFMKFLEDNTDKIWSIGEKPTKFDGWYIYGTDTVIYGDGIYSANRLTFGDMQNAEGYGYSVIEFEDLMKEENNMKFKVGDKVRVRSWESMAKEFGVTCSGDIFCYCMFLSEMKKFCETVHTIKSVNNEFKYYSLEDVACYRFSDDVLEPVKAETNGEHFRKELKELKGCSVAIVDGKPIKCTWGLPRSKCLFHGMCGSCEEAFKKWCSEPYKEPEEQTKPENKPILDKEEHDYLAVVIAPKRIYDNVRCIMKEEVFKGKYYILIRVASSYIHLPRFKKEYHMYDGMELDRPYTLKELDLEKEGK